MYSVEYRAFGATQWSKLTDLIADGVVPESPHRFFIDKDGVRYEIPFTNVEFKFAKERMELLQKQREFENKQSTTAPSQ